MNVDIRAKTEVLSFFQELSKDDYHPIDRDEEVRLINLYNKHKDESALQTLINRNMRFVVSYVLKTLNGKEIIDGLDIFHSGTIGLIIAIKKFKPRLKCKLVTYATHWIRHEIQKYKRERRLISLTHYITFGIQKTRDALCMLEKRGRQYTTGDIVAQSGLTKERIESAKRAQQIQCINTEHLMSFKNNIVQHELTADPLEYAIHVENVSRVRDAINLLPEPEAEIINRRFLAVPGEPLSYRQIARKMNCSHEQVRKLESRGMNKLRAILQSCADMN